MTHGVFGLSGQRLGNLMDNCDVVCCSTSRPGMVKSDDLVVMASFLGKTVAIS